MASGRRPHRRLTENDRELAKGAVRLSLGWSTTDADIDCCLEAWRKLSSALLMSGDETELERF